MVLYLMRFPLPLLSNNPRICHNSHNHNSFRSSSRNNNSFRSSSSSSSSFRSSNSRHSIRFSNNHSNSYNNHSNNCCKRYNQRRLFQLWEQPQWFLLRPFLPSDRNRQF